MCVFVRERYRDCLCVFVKGECVCVLLLAYIYILNDDD